MTWIICLLHLYNTYELWRQSFVMCVTLSMLYSFLEEDKLIAISKQEQQIKCNLDSNAKLHIITIDAHLKNILLNLMIVLEKLHFLK
jgi:hypothetical protein